MRRSSFTSTLGGSVVGTHAGPGAVGFFWFQDKDDQRWLIVGARSGRLRGVRAVGIRSPEPEHEARSCQGAKMRLRDTLDEPRTTSVGWRRLARRPALAARTPPASAKELGEQARGGRARRGLLLRHSGVPSRRRRSRSVAAGCRSSTTGGSASATTGCSTARRSRGSRSSARGTCVRSSTGRRWRELARTWSRVRAASCTTCRGGTPTSASSGSWPFGDGSGQFDHILEGVPLDELVEGSFRWQPRWLYTLAVDA